MLNSSLNQMVVYFKNKKKTKNELGAIFLLGKAVQQMHFNEEVVPGLCPETLQPVSDLH